MRVRSWACTWLGLVPALLLTASAFGDELKFAGPTLLYPDVACAGDVAPECDADCCEPAMCCCDCRSPFWSFQAGAVFLRRDHQTDLPLTNGATPISVGDLAFNDYQGGPAVTLIRHNLLGGRTSLEVTYFGVRDSNAATTAGATAFFTVPNIGFGARNVSVDYRSSLDSTEINFRDTFADWFTVLGGFRWVELSDELSTDLGGGSTHRVNVNNHLYGAQIGVDILILSSDRFSIEWIGKAGIYGNAADQNTTITGVLGAVPSLSASDNPTAFIGEMDLTAKYAFNCHWSIIGGYKVMWLDDIALAPNQLAVSNVATGAATLDTNGQPIYHGFTVAAELVW